MTNLERKRLALLRKQIPGHMTVDEALDLAIQAEQFKKDCGPFDPAFKYFVEQQEMFEALAYLLEKENTSNSSSCGETYVG